MKPISSTDNGLYKSICHLARSPRARRAERRIVLDGVHLVRAYLACFGPHAAQLAIRKSAATHPEIAALAVQAKSLTMSDSLFDKLSPVASPVGIIALAPLPELPIPAERSFDVILDGVQDPGNLGAILRSAAAAGARQAHLSADCADPWSPKSLRGGMGAQFVLRVQQHLSLADAAQSIGAQLVACAAVAAVSVFDADLSGHIAFIVGGEGAGISSELLAKANQQIRVPMKSGIESLNAAAAAAVCFFEWLRQNNAKIPFS